MRKNETFAIYRQWWRDHYGYECPISEAEFERYISLNHHRANASSDFDAETERREGWAYD